MLFQVLFFLSFNYAHTHGATLNSFVVFYYIDIFNSLISSLMYIQVVFNFCYNKCCNRHPSTYLFIHMRKVFLGHITHYRRVKNIFIKQIFGFGAV